MITAVQGWKDGVEEKVNEMREMAPKGHLVTCDA